MFLVAALILLIAGSSWFAGAHTVGLILLIPAALELFAWVFALLVGGLGAFLTLKRP